MAGRILHRLALAFVLALSATFLGGIGGALIGSRIVPAHDAIEKIANAIAGMTIGCGVLMAVATYLSTRLDIPELRKLTALVLLAAILALGGLWVWDRTHPSRIFDTRSPAIPVYAARAPERTGEAIEASNARTVDISSVVDWRNALPS